MILGLNGLAEIAISVIPSTARDLVFSALTKTRHLHNWLLKARNFYPLRETQPSQRGGNAPPSAYILYSATVSASRGNSFTTFCTSSPVSGDGSRPISFLKSC